jgi:amphi-Trp domain-containing protein
MMPDLRSRGRRDARSPRAPGRRPGRLPPRREFEFEGIATPADAAETLSRLAEGIRTGALRVGAGDRAITVFPEPHLALEIEARERKGKSRIEIAIAWKRDLDDGSG